MEHGVVLQMSKWAKGLCLWLRAVRPEDLEGAQGGVTVLAAHSVGEQHRVLVAHEDSPAVVWDLRWGGCCLLLP